MNHQPFRADFEPFFLTESTEDWLRALMAHTMAQASCVVSVVSVAI